MCIKFFTNYNILEYHKQRRHKNVRYTHLLFVEYLYIRAYLLYEEKLYFPYRSQFCEAAVGVCLRFQHHLIIIQSAVITIIIQYRYILVQVLTTQCSKKPRVQATLLVACHRNISSSSPYKLYILYAVVGNDVARAEPLN